MIVAGVCLLALGLIGTAFYKRVGPSLPASDEWLRMQERFSIGAAVLGTVLILVGSVIVVVNKAI